MIRSMTHTQLLELRDKFKVIRDSFSDNAERLNEIHSFLVACSRDYLSQNDYTNLIDLEKDLQDSILDPEYLYTFKCGSCTISIYRVDQLYYVRQYFGPRYKTLLEKFDDFNNAKIFYLSVVRSYCSELSFE